MVLLSGIRGQDNAVRYLSNSLAHGRISNGYLFAGPQGVGKALAARAFLMALMCPKSGRSGACGECPVCGKVGALEHPDIMWIRPGKNRTIRIDDIRRAKDRLHLKPYESPVSACVIEDADMMTPVASNALLKLLEEPPGRSLLILISSRRELLLPTVVSRCEEVRFQYLSAAETKDIIMRHSDMDEETACFLGYLSEGSPGRALELTDKKILARRNGIADFMEKMAGEKDASCLNWDREGREELLGDLELLMTLCRDIVMVNEGLAELALDKGTMNGRLYDLFKEYSPDRTYGMMERLIKLKRDLEGNVNPRLVAQVLPRELCGEKRSGLNRGRT